MLNIQVNEGEGNVNVKLSGTLSNILSEFTVASIALYRSLYDESPEGAEIFRIFLETGLGECFDHCDQFVPKPQKDSTADPIAQLIRLLGEKQ